MGIFHDQPKKLVMAAEPIPSVVVDSITKRFGETLALSCCSLRFLPGEVHAIVGENGSGKSTLAKTVSGVVIPDSGTLSVFGQTPASPRAARRLGVATIFQEVLVADNASVTDNLFVGTEGIIARPLSRSEQRRRAGELMKRLAGAAVDPDVLVGSLPLSIKQWIVIGRALLADPKVLILDESSAALDLDATSRLHGEIRALRSRGATIIIVTHRIAELVGIADRVTILRDGVVTGEILKPDLTEENLLAAMMPAKVVHARADSGAVNGTAQAPVLTYETGPEARRSNLSCFTLMAGEIVGVAGLEGQGQDLFIRTLAGLGSVSIAAPSMLDEEFGAQSLRTLRDAERLGIAYVSGDRKREGIFPNLSIYENLVLNLIRAHRGLFGWTRHEKCLQAFDAEVKRLAIKMGSPGNKITSLSGGNQQKVLIGRALAGRPRILVMNDPARGIDIGAKVELYTQLRRFAEEGGSVVYLSSEIEEFPGFADRVAVFHNGDLSRILEGTEIAEHAVLAAMFGRRSNDQLDFESSEAVA